MSQIPSVVTSIKNANELSALLSVNPGLIIIKLIENNAEIDTFLLSCRILGKDIEMFFLERVLHELKALKINNIYAKYIYTKKNKQVEDLYSKCNFSLLNESKTEKNYVLKIQKFNYSNSNIYKIKK